MANLVYGRPTDNIAATATAITASAPDAAYPAMNLVDLNPAKPAKLTTTSGNWVFDFGSAKQVDLVALIHHNFQAGLNVRWQGNATDSWGSPSIDQPVVIPAYRENGHPMNPFLDITGIGLRTFRYWRLVVVGTNPVVCALGELVILGSKRTLERNISWGYVDEEDSPIIEHRTAYGVSAASYSLGTTWRTLRAEIETIDSGADSLLSLTRSAFGRATPFLVIPDPSVNCALFGKPVETTINISRVFKNSNTTPFVFQELSCGLKPTPSAV
jgi:hypothetical protein